MDNRTRYFPPRIDTTWLNEATFCRYPSHRSTDHSRAMIIKLTQEYIKFWRLVLSFPERRIVAPGPILAVQRVHFDDRKRYFDDCMEYFNRYLAEELYWHGRGDVIGTLETVVSYQTLFKEDPPEPWFDIVAEYNLGRSSLRLV